MQEITRAALWDCNSASYKITSKGLEFSIDKATQKVLKRLQKLEEKGEPVGFHMDELFMELIEHCLCNGLSTVQPEHIGALTSSMIFSEGNFTDDNGNPCECDAPVFWYPNYAVRSPIEDLAEYGNVIFTE